jgi:hypothetical protein
MCNAMRVTSGFVIVASALSSACKPEFGPACDAYMACASASGLGGQMEATYGADGPCWEDEEAAAICEASCADALAQAETSYPLVESCDSGDGLAANEAFFLVSRWSYELNALTSEPPCDDVSTAEATLTMEAGSEASFSLDGALDADTSRFDLSASCTLEWGGFACAPAELPYDEVVTTTGTFTADMLSSQVVVVIDSFDQDPDTQEDVACSYTLELSGGPS